MIKKNISNLKKRCPMDKESRLDEEDKGGIQTHNIRNFIWFEVYVPVNLQFPRFLVINTVKESKNICSVKDN